MTAVSCGEVVTEEKSWVASAARKETSFGVVGAGPAWSREVGARPFNSRFSIADAIDDGAISIPTEDWKRSARVMVKRPEPE
jgi:hypothetical protein